MSTLRVVLGDHLTRDISSLADIDPSRDIVLMMEVMEEATYRGVNVNAVSKDSAGSGRSSVFSNAQS